MYILLCIDDTDSIDSKGTGELAENLAHDIEDSGLGKCYAVTRHQLLLHKDIPYTSHNSSMCFAAEIGAECLDNIINYASNFLQLESQPESDPGLCVVVVDELEDKKKLIDFGYRAKREVLTKENAYDLAKELNVHLSEHGGTGLGVIGALAGTGLRLSGNDGWLRGTIKVNAPDKMIKVSEICSYNNIDKVRTVSEIDLQDDETIMIGNMVKSILIEGEFVLLVDKMDTEVHEVKWKTCSKQQLRKYEEMNENVVCK